MLCHLDWDSDHLVVEEQGHKGDQSGTMKYGKAVYANPLQPCICPVLALAVLCFSKPMRYKLFDGEFNSDRAGSNLRELIRSMTGPEMLLLGNDIVDVGLYSLRKGSSSYCINLKGGPSAETVNFRMGHSNGKLNDKYWSPETGGGDDQVCGRLVCGLPYHDYSFSMLPPHFDRETNLRLDGNFWRTVIHNYAVLPASFQRILPYLLASILYHDDWLRQTLPSTHPVFLSGIFTQNELLVDLKSKVLTGVGFCVETQMRATGLPIHLAITKRLADVEAGLATILTELNENIPERTATLMFEKINRNLVINGVVPLSVDDFERRFGEMATRLLAEIRQGVSGLATTPHTETEVDAPEQRMVPVSWWRQWSWNDQYVLHFVPPEFVFPSKVCVVGLCSLWFLGDQQKGIRPYRLIPPRLDLKTVAQRGLYAKAKSCVAVIEKIAVEKNLLPEGVTTLGNSGRELMAAVHSAYDCLIETLYPKTAAEEPGRARKFQNGHSRPHDISFTTIYNRLRTALE
jgi:hypothetical protein